MAVTYNKIPELINDMRVYREGNDDCIGVAEIQLPKFTSMTQTIDGVGVGGEVDSPIVGILLFQVAGSSAAILGANSFLSLELSEYICPKCGGLMENTDIKTYYNEYNETTGGNAHFRNVKLGEAKSESGKTFEVYGQ